jgi:hypothetical protein
VNGGQMSRFPLLEMAMKKSLIITLLSLGFIATVLGGCRAAVDVDPHSSTSVSLTR